MQPNGNLQTNRATLSHLRKSAVLLVTAIPLACGGAQTSEARAPEQRDDEPKQESRTVSEQQPSGAPRVTDPCADGSCAPCGKAVCLSGFWCDEQTEACSWLPECADHLDCACVSRAMPDCECEERGGGVYVRCN